MPGYTTFHVWKKTGTYADTLAAAGLLEMLWTLNRGVEEPVLYEGSAGFRVVCSNPVQLATLDYAILQRDPLYRFISTKDGEDSLNPDNSAYNYLANKALADAKREKRKLRTAGVDMSEMQGPDSLFYIYQQIHMLQGVGARNKLYEEIYTAPADRLQDAVQAKLQALAEGRPPADVDTSFSPKVAALQVFQPAAGKGTNRPKADSPARGPLPAPFVDWFEEWLRFIGVDQLLSGYRLGDDIKIVVPVPKRMERGLLKQFRGKTPSIAWTSRKADILSVFDTLEWLLDEDENSASWGYGVQPGDSPADTVSSIQSAYFKSLGSAKPVMNISAIGLPNWFPVNNEADVGLWKRMIDEHKRVLVLLDERKSEEEALLQLYRDFIATSDWRMFLCFLGSYGCLTISRRNNNKPVRSFSQFYLEELLMRMDKLVLGPILGNAGFRRVAEAIRLATVSEQYAKSKKQQVFDIKYSLFQDLKRSAKFPEQFMATIFEFINEFNMESARRAEQLGEKPGRRRKRLSEAEIEQFAMLLDSCKESKDFETIAMLLIALASAKGDPTQGAPDDDEYGEEELEEYV